MTFAPEDRVTHEVHGPGTIIRKTRRHRFVVDFDRHAKPCRVLAVNLEPIGELIGEDEP